MRRPERRQATRPTGIARCPRPARPSGFTLVELLIVMVIIGILLAFILAAAMDGVRRAEERATQALISKLETGLTDRVEALSISKTDAIASHLYMSGFYSTTYGVGGPNEQRAMIIAQFDKMKAELPDVFYVNSGSLYANYPFNFAAAPYPGVNSSAVDAGVAPYLLPLGSGMLNDPKGTISGTVSYGAANNVNIPNTTGVLGASYAARGGFAKQLGANPQGFDGADNNGNGMVDEVFEWGDRNANGSIDGNESGVLIGDVTAKLGNHTHKTARAETLYAVLVYGFGPLGSVFDADDFNDREVKDTDGDGLLEFVDAWGEPIQFFRWPIYYHGTGHPEVAGYIPATQRGYLEYVDASLTPSRLIAREQNPLDPNQSLMSPEWWSSAFSDATPSTTVVCPFLPSGPVSGAAAGFTQFFIPLTDPWSNPSVSLSNTAGLWDRGAVYPQRREYYSRFLVLSGGPDKTPGVAVLSKEYFDKLDYIETEVGTSQIATTVSGFSFPTGVIATDTHLALIESQGGSVTPFRSQDAYQTPLSLSGNAGHLQIDSAIRTAGDDDITNHNLMAPGGVIQ